MVELRKRPAAPPPAPPAKKRAPSKSKADKDASKAVDPDKKPAPPATDNAVAEEASASTSGAPTVGELITLAGFGGEIETNDGDKTTLAKLVSDSKAGVVLFTYPKASTPGCKTLIIVANMK